MPDGYVLSDADRAAVQRLIAREVGQIRNTVNRPGNLQTDLADHPAPEVYAVKTPSDGIPALQQLGTGTGSSNAATPGSADCELYQIVEDGSSVTLERLADDSKVTVYNLSQSDLPANTWLLAVRDKFGNYFAAAGGGSGTSDKIVQCTGAKSGNFWPGKLVTFDPDSGAPTPGEVVKILALNGAQLSNTVYYGGAIYQGNNVSGVPVYAVNGGLSLSLQVLTMPDCTPETLIFDGGQLGDTTTP
jgi:hypothetical protein